MTLLQVRNLKLHYSTSSGSVRAVDGVSFDILKPGEAVGLVGESGSGKSSLAISLMRLLPANATLLSGQINFEGQNLAALPLEKFRKDIRSRVMAMVVQGAMNALNPVLRVGNQITERVLLESDVNKNQAFDHAREILELVGLPEEILQRYPHELSGGMKQRVVIAMGLVMEPKILILDEPTSALDVSVQAQVMNLLKRLKHDRGISMLFITHDIALTSDLCDRVVVAYAGEHVESGTSEEVLTSPKHPYTQKLIASIPRLHDSGRPEFLEGQPPDLVSPPGGCRFHPRCPVALEHCSREPPPEFNVGPNHTVRCWLYSEIGEDS
ncbi:ABC transporter ATP-binding protein [Dehalococcoidia bacterium]|nr:ABC transporter ATP-binding protein [Dehalococcoidia bacterium]